jgi:hypothetical protein
VQTPHLGVKSVRQPKWKLAIVANGGRSHEDTLNNRRILRRPISLALALALISGAATPVIAQEIAKTMSAPAEAWHPKDGIYAYGGKDFDVRCSDFGELTIALARSKIMGYEVSCKVTNRTRIAPETLKINLLCLDYNLAAHLGKPDEWEFKEVMLLRRINETTLSVQKTINGKLTDPSAQATYCPEPAQRKYTEMLRRDREAKKADAAAKTLEKWVPKDGVYATPGADFNDRCLKLDGLVLGLSDGSVSLGQNKCNIYNRPDWRPNEINLQMICNGKTGSNEIYLRKTNDRTIMIRGKNALMKADGPVEYCGEEAQRAYREQRAAK